MRWIMNKKPLILVIISVLVTCSAVGLFLFSGVSKDDINGINFINAVEVSAREYTGPDYTVVENMKEVLIEGYRRFDTEIDVSRYGAVWEEVTLAYLGAVQQYPEFFYIAKDIKFDYDVDDERKAIKNVKPYYIWPVEEIPQKQAEYERAVNEALSVINDDMTDVEKALALHDYIVQTAEYDFEAYSKRNIPSLSYTSYGIFIEKRAVCEGYALAVLELYRRAGLECITVGSSAMDHVWNLVKLDGEWYHVDTTWDDMPPEVNGRVLHTYFLLSDEQMQNHSPAHHSWDEKAPRATDSETFNEWFWKNVKSELKLINGYWYFVERVV